MQATFFAFGLNHRTASVDTSEAFSLSEAALARVHETFRAGAAPAEEDGPELVLLSTCNRTEAYLYGDAGDVERLQALLASEAGRAWPGDAETFNRTDEAAVRHVLAVTAGLRSLVPGDAQILAQVKDAYRQAVAADAVGTVGHRLMHTAFRAAKRVQRETDLASGAASVSTAAVALAEDFFRRRLPKGWTERRALLVGAGKMGRLALEALADRPQAGSDLAVTNRSSARAEEAAHAFEADVVPWEARHAAAARADLVVVATGADEPTLRAEALPERAPSAEASTLVVDIARPRNADPAIAARPGYALRDMDALDDWVRQTRRARQEALPKGEAICEDLMSEFVSWAFHQEAMQPAIQAIRSTFDSIRQQEIERYAHRFSDADAEDLERLTQSILQKLLAVPIVRLKGAGPESMHFARGIQLLEDLFSRPGCEGGEAEQPEVTRRTGDASAGEKAALAKLRARFSEAAPGPAAFSEEPGGEQSSGGGRPVDAPARCPFETHQRAEGERPLQEREA